MTAVAVAGAGVTGASWAGLFIAQGLEVRLYDRDPAALAGGRAAAERAGRFLVEHGLAAAAALEAGLAGLQVCRDPAEAFAGVDLVQECVVEDLAAKQALFALADAVAPAAALLATSSSGLSISRIQEGAARPGRCLAAHPYNPPHLVPLVEIAPGERTGRDTVERAVAFYRAVGKEPVVVGGDLPGYVANRLSAALWREAVELVRTGVASVADVDRAVREGPGLRWAVMGPHLVYHLGGGASGIRRHLEHLGASKAGVLADLATWVAFPDDSVEALARGVEEEIAGRSVAELIAERDEALAEMLVARRRRRAT